MIGLKWEKNKMNFIENSPARIKSRMFIACTSTQPNPTQPKQKGHRYPTKTKRAQAKLRQKVNHALSDPFLASFEF